MTNTTEAPATEAAAPVVESNPFIDASVDPLPGIEMNFDEDGLSFTQTEQPVEEAVEEPEAPADAPAETDSWEDRYKGLQSKSTQAFQELAQIKAKLEAQEQAQASSEQSQVMQQTIQELADEFFPQNEYGETSLSREGVVNFVEKATNKIFEQAAAPLIQRLETVQIQQEVGQETLGLLTTYGERVNDLGPVVAGWAQHYPQIANGLASGQITMTQAFQWANQALAGQQSGQSAPTGSGTNTDAGQQAPSYGSDPGQPQIDLNALQQRAQRLQTQEGVSSGDVSGLGAEPAPRTIQGAIEAAFADWE